MPEEKTYIKGVSLKKIEFQSGGHILKLGVRVDALIEQLQRLKNDKGYVNLCISERRSVGQYGDTHCLWLDTWKPKQQAERSEPQNDPPPFANYTPPPKEETTVVESELPF